MNNRTINLFFTLLLMTVSSELAAQDFNEEFRRRLREEMTQPQRTPQMPFQPQPSQARPILPQQQSEEILRVSPTTVLPTRYDKIQTLVPPELMRVEIRLNYTNEDRSAVARSRIDYATGKYNPIPDSRSTAQRAQFSGFSGPGGIVGSGGKMQSLDIYYDENSPEWVQKVGERMNRRGRGDFQIRRTRRAYRDVPKLNMLE